MKILDPQAALLTNLEVHHFLENNQPRKPDKKSGAYEPVNLQEYYNVRKDFKRYIDGTTPYIKQFPPPEQFISKVVQRLKKYDLTKTEVLSIINHGLGLPRRAQPPQATNTRAANGPIENGDNHAAEADADADAGADADADAGADADADVPAGEEEDDGVELNFRALAECVIDSLADRFPGDEGEDKIDSILAVLEQCIHEAKPA